MVLPILPKVLAAGFFFDGIDVDAIVRCSSTPTIPFLTLVTPPRPRFVCVACLACYMGLGGNGAATGEIGRGVGGGAGDEAGCVARRTRLHVGDEGHGELR